MELDSHKYDFQYNLIYQEFDGICDELKMSCVIL